MSVPPSGRRPSSSSPSRHRPDDDDNHKEFKLPPKKNYVDAKESKEEELKKKGLFDIAAQESGVQDKQQNLAETLKAESIKVDGVKSAEAVAQVAKVSQLIQNMVSAMRIGEIDGKTFASLDLKKGPEVPEAFAGSHLTVSYQDNALSIRFDRFMSTQQENTAIVLVEKNKEQLEQMVQALNARNIQVTELLIGNHTVALPRVEPLPPPFQAPPSAQAEQQRRQGGGQQDQGKGGQDRRGPR